MDIMFNYHLEGKGLCIHGIMSRDDVRNYMKSNPSLKIKKEKFFMIGGQKDNLRNDRSIKDYEMRQKHKNISAHRHLVDAIMDGRNIIWG